MITIFGITVMSLEVSCPRFLFNLSITLDTYVSNIHFFPLHSCCKTAHDESKSNYIGQQLLVAYGKSRMSLMCVLELKSTVMLKYTTRGIIHCIMNHRILVKCVRL